LAGQPTADLHVTCMHVMHAVPGLNKRLRVRWAVSWLVERWWGKLDHINLFIQQHLLTATLSISITIKLVFFYSILLLN